MDWTPRPPHPDEPACWSWPVPAPVDAATEQARLLTRMSPGAVELMLLGRGGGDPRWDEFHADRCAICGADYLDLIDDHCHRTGQERGRLCRGCNTREGHHANGAVPLLDRYRRWHPAAILDHHGMYTGIGWDRGWSLREHGDMTDHGERPATPWPPFDPAMLAGGG